MINGGDLRCIGQCDPNPRPRASARRSSKRFARRCRRAAAGLAAAGDPVRHPGGRKPRHRRAPARTAWPSRSRSTRSAVSGSSPPLEIFAIAVAATLTLAFVTVLLVAGSLALEREENAFPRLTRGLVSPTALLGEKVLLGVAVGLVVTLLMLAGLAIFVPLRLEPLRPLAGGDRRRRRGARRGGGGARRGGPRGPRRLAARLHGDAADRLPLAGPLRHGRARASTTRSRSIIALFPFKPALRRDDRAPRPGRRSIGGPLLHLAILIVAYGLIARLALRRFAAV